MDSIPPPEMKKSAQKNLEQEIERKSARKSERGSERKRARRSEICILPIHAHSKLFGKKIQIHEV